jgi:putative FmdB family regulatory protein
MPIYEYECQACGHRQEAIQKMSDDPLVDCPACGKPELKKLLSAPAFRLKGSGWYETDFKGDKQKNKVKEGSANKPSKSESPGSSNSCGTGGCG